MIAKLERTQSCVLTLCTWMDSSIWFDKINFEWFIMQIKGSEVKIFKLRCILTPSLLSISACNMPGEIRLFWLYYGVTYNFIQNHNNCRDLHQIFSCLFETFGTMSEIMFSSDSMSKNFFNSWKYMNVYFVYNIIVLEWFENNGSKMWEWQEFPPLPLLIPINIICHPYTSHFRLPK